METPFTAVHLDVVSSTQDASARERFVRKPVLVSATGRTPWDEAGPVRCGDGTRSDGSVACLATRVARKVLHPVDLVKAQTTWPRTMSSIAEVGLKWPNDLMSAGPARWAEFCSEQAGGVNLSPDSKVNLFLGRIRHLRYNAAQ